MFMNKLREFRFLKGISQWRLAYLSRVHQSRISLSENGLIGLTVDEKERLAEALSVAPKELFGDREAPIPGERR
jgi:transcriptional regulator with XRE-family HTH domain